MKDGLNRADIEHLLQSADDQVVIEALMSMCFNINDSKWVQRKCIEVITGKGNDEVKGLAITCLGHVARIHADIDREMVMPVLLECMKDVSLSGRVQDALDDIDMFVK